MMQQEDKGAPIDADAAQLQPSGEAQTPPRQRDAVALWRALAGMAISLALACLIVMLEFTGLAAHRADRMHRRSNALLSRVARLEVQMAAAQAQIATAHRDLAAAESLRALLRAPDAGMLLLVPPAASPAARGGRTQAAAAARVGPEATLALGPREHRAVLLVSGLKAPANDMRFVLWWSAAHRAPVRAAEFHTAPDGSALLTAALPPGLEVTAAMITAERTAKSDAAGGAAAPSEPAAPAGPVQLRGTLAR